MNDHPADGDGGKPLQSMAPATWLAAYRAGDRDRVWREMRQLGATVRSPRIVPHARAVCDEMARRARHNIETIVDRLRVQGYVFHANDDDPAPVIPFVPASPGAGELARWLQAQWGPIPLTLASWMEHVGDVWLVGSHPAWKQAQEADPLVIELEGTRYPGGVDVRGYFAEAHGVWQEAARNGRDTGRFVLPVAPDRLTKANVSGGQPYGVRIPDGGADGVFCAGKEMGFVDYLNDVFSHGGFSGRVGGKHRRRILRGLSEGLLLL